jgi:hypothetical protein
VSREPRWIEPLRLGYAVLWTVVLTWFYLWQLIYLETLQSEYAGTRTAASAMLRSFPFFWTISFFPALAMGMATYGVTLLPWRFRWRHLDPPSNRRVRLQLYSAFSLALLLNLFVYRLWFVIPFIGADTELASPGVLGMHGLVDSGMTTATTKLFMFVSVAFAWIVFSEVWGGIRGLGRPLRPFLTAFSAVLAVGLLSLLAAPYRYLPLQLDDTASEINAWPVDSRGFVLGDINHDAQERWRRVYLETHDDEGNPLPVWRVHRFQGSVGSACRTVLLPPTTFLLPAGIPINLSGEELEEIGPGWSIEVPASADQIRIFGVDTHQGPEIRPLSPFPEMPPGAKWVVLKADASLKMETIRDLFAGLRDRGVQRITLAARSVGWAHLGEAIPLLDLRGQVDSPTFEPEMIPGSRKEVIYVSRWIPPPGAEPQIVCNPEDPYHTNGAELDYSIPARASLPSTMSMSEHGNYADFILRVGRMIAGGVATIQITIPSEETKDQ